LNVLDIVRIVNTKYSPSFVAPSSCRRPDKWATNGRFGMVADSPCLNSPRRLWECRNVRSSAARSWSNDTTAPYLEKTSMGEIWSAVVKRMAGISPKASRDRCRGEVRTGLNALGLRAWR
jgi:hypothetical protein